jgi:hypothetical protein
MQKQINKSNNNFFWKGIKHNIPLCCIFFFESGWKSIKNEIGEYAETMDLLTNNQGIILCPDCLIENIRFTQIN